MSAKESEHNHEQRRQCNEGPGLPPGWEPDACHVTIPDGHTDRETAVRDLDNLIRNLDVGAIFLDLDFRIRKFSQAAQKVINITDEDISESIEPLAGSLGISLRDDLTHVCDRQASVERQIRGARGDWIRMRLSPYVVDAGKPDGVVITFVDVTATKNVQEMIRLNNDRLAQLGNELSQQREELEDLLSIVAHDLKRPVVALNGIMAIYQDGSLSDAERADLYRQAMKESTRVRCMLDDLARVSRVTREEQALERVDLQPWMESLIQRSEEEAEQRGVHMTYLCDAGQILMPRAALEEALVNLVENAFKYGCTDAKPRIDIECHINSDRLVLSVRDNGKGIEPRNHHKIFEPFRRLDPEMADGTGVGLLAVKRMVSKNGGTIELESSEGAGAKFTIQIPVQNDSDENQAPFKPRVLVVEDEVLDARMIKRYLRDEYTITQAKSVSEAETQLKEEVYDIVLSDLSLPDGHGLEFVNRLRTILCIDVPVVIISGHAEGMTPGTMTSTIDGCVSKASLTKEVLCTTVSEAFERHRRKVSEVAS